jgi:hypothetical protein
MNNTTDPQPLTTPVKIGNGRSIWIVERYTRENIRAIVSLVKDDPWMIPTTKTVYTHELQEVVAPNVCNCGTAPHFARHSGGCKFYTK